MAISRLTGNGSSILSGTTNWQKNKGDSDLYLTSLVDGRTKRITSGPTSEWAAQWITTVKGQRLLFLSARGSGASPQVWSLDPKTGDLAQVTNEDGGVANLKVSPTGKHIAFTKDIQLDQTAQDIYPDLPLADGRIIDSLMYRHWDSWHDYKYSHVHVAALSADFKAGPAIDLMPGLKADCPVPPFGGSEHFALGTRRPRTGADHQDCCELVRVYR